MMKVAVNPNSIALNNMPDKRSVGMYMRTLIGNTNGEIVLFMPIDKFDS